MVPGRQFRVDERRVVHETIDGETILIDLDTGIYYCLAGSGPEIWRLLLEGWADTEVTQEMQRRHTPDGEDAAAGTAKMIEQLHGEGLLEEVEPEGRYGPPAPTPAPGDQPFARPVLERYTDMQNFLLLDPIHDVGPAGWPHVPAPDQAFLQPRSTR